MKYKIIFTLSLMVASLVILRNREQKISINSQPTFQQRSTMPQGSVTTATQTPHHPELVKSESNSFEPKESDFRRLSRKILKTQAEKERYAKILSNEKNLKEALSQIETHEAFFSKQSERARMAAIDFLTQACRWKENPLRMNILTELTSFLKTPVSIAGQEPRQTKSLLGDRIELFLLLSAQDPQKASLILEEVKGTPEDAYYQFASTFYHQKGGN